jgi:hypothetical protein
LLSKQTSSLFLAPAQAVSVQAKASQGHTKG